MPKNEDRKTIKCSFCGKSQEQVGLSSRSGVYIMIVHRFMFEIIEDEFDEN